MKNKPLFWKQHKQPAGFVIVFCSLIYAIFFVSCASLTKSQVSGVNSYSGLLKSYTLYPGFVISEFIQLKYEVEQLNTGTFNDTAAFTQLLISYNGKKLALKQSAKLDLGIKIIAQYATALQKISSPGLSGKLAKGSEELGTQIDTLVSEYNQIAKEHLPAGFGTMISDAVTFLGNSYLHHKQARAVRDFVAEGEKVLPSVIAEIRKELTDLVLNNWLIALNEEMKSRQINFLQNIPHSEYKVYIANEYNKEVARLIGKIDTLKQLTVKAISSVKHIQKAHSQLLANLQKRKQLKEVLSETQRLYCDVYEMYNDYKHLKAD